VELTARSPHFKPKVGRRQPPRPTSGCCSC
jgi:hypothetical protein